MKKEEKIKTILCVICENCNVNENDIKSDVRKQEIVLAKQMASYFLRYELGITFDEIGRILNKKSSTIARHVNSLTDCMRHDIIL
jgi:chromosomal replication initiation ATPase DnaA